MATNEEQPAAPPAAPEVVASASGAISGSTPPSTAATTTATGESDTAKLTVTQLGAVRVLAKTMEQMPPSVSLNDVASAMTKQAPKNGAARKQDDDDDDEDDDDEELPPSQRLVVLADVMSAEDLADDDLYWVGTAGKKLTRLDGIAELVHAKQVCFRSNFLRNIAGMQQFFNYELTTLDST
jgi:hypothetical protein